VGGSGVAQDVGQRLLGDAIEDQLLLFRKRRQILGEVTLDLQLTLAFGSCGKGDQSIDQAKVVKSLGAQLARDPPDLVKGRLQLSGKRGHLSSLTLRPVRGRPLDLKDDRSQGLAGFVVQGASDPQTLAFLSNEGRPGTGPPLIGEAFEHRVEGVGERSQLNALGRATNLGPLGMAEIDLLHFGSEMSQRSKGTANPDDIQEEQGNESQRQDDELARLDRGTDRDRGHN
jgi:hypothetical protein